MHVVKIASLWPFIGFHSEPNHSCSVPHNSQRVDATKQDVDSKIVLQSIDEERVGNVLLHADGPLEVEVMRVLGEIDSISL